MPEEEGRRRSEKERGEKRVEVKAGAIREGGGGRGGGLKARTGVGRRVEKQK